MINTFRDLFIWQKSMLYVKSVYKMMEKLPYEENVGLKSQIKRSAISLPSNIAEGFGRKSTKDYIRFLNRAISSLYENQTQIELCYNLDYLNENEFLILHNQTKEIEIMTLTMIKKLSLKLK